MRLIEFTVRSISHIDIYIYSNGPLEEAEEATTRIASADSERAQLHQPFLFFFFGGGGGCEIVRPKAQQISTDI